MKPTKANKTKLLSVIPLFLSLAGHCLGTNMPHAGHVSVDGKPFDGEGHFKFAIVDAAGTILWSNDGTPAGEPAKAVAVKVKGGFYGLELGNTELAYMNTLPPSALKQDGPTALRIWFDEGDGTFERLGEDQRLGAAPYALVAELSRGTPALEIKLSEVEQKVNDLMTALDAAEVEINGLKAQLTAANSLIDNLPASSIDPILLAEVGYRRFPSRALLGLNMPGGDFTKADFSKVELRDANLDGGDFSLANFPDAGIEDSNFSGAVLSNVNLTSARINGARFDNADLRGTSFAKADVNGTDFSGANLSSADLSNASFSNVKMPNVSFRGASLWKTSLKGIDLSGGDLTNLDSSATDFSNANLNNARISGFLTGADFSGANLTGADFSGADLTRAKLEDAIGFDPDNYSDVIYNGTILPNGSIRTD